VAPSPTSFIAARSVLVSTRGRAHLDEAPAVNRPSTWDRRGDERADAIRVAIPEIARRASACHEIEVRIDQELHRIFEPSYRRPSALDAQRLQATTARDQVENHAREEDRVSMLATRPIDRSPRSL